jgi:hypothetical protein
MHAGVAALAGGTFEKQSTNIANETEAKPRAAASAVKDFRRSIVGIPYYMDGILPPLSRQMMGLYASNLSVARHAWSTAVSKTRTIWYFLTQLKFRNFSRKEKQRGFRSLKAHGKFRPEYEWRCAARYCELVRPPGQWQGALGFRPPLDPPRGEGEPHHHPAPSAQPSHEASAAMVSQARQPRGVWS